VTELLKPLGKLIPDPADAALTPDERAVVLAVEAILATQIKAHAKRDDAAGRYPTGSIAALKPSGLFQASLPGTLGGLGAGHRFSLEVQLRLAMTDSSVAQVFKVHDELVREVLCYCPPFQRQRIATQILEQDAVLGLAVAEAGRTAQSPMQTEARPDGRGGFIVDGVKIYTTGAAEADVIATWGFNAAAATAEAPLLGMQMLLIPRDTPGVTIHRDWDVLGQRATDSGSITFNNVCCPAEWVGSVPGEGPLVHSSLRYQAGFAAVLTGIGLGALAEATEFVRTQSRPWATAHVERACDDPMLQRTTGELAADLAAAYSLVMSTADLLDTFESAKGDRAALALPISAAKSVAHRASLRACSEIHGLMGTRSVSSRFGFDRWWRNARTLSLHDPVEYKHVELGRHLLTAWDPEPGVYQ